MWELALIASVLGTAFFLVYLSTTIDGENKWLQVMKVFLVLSAMVLILVNVSMPHFIIEGANQTITTPFVNTTYDKFTNQIDTTVFVTMWVFIFFMVMFTAYFLITLFSGLFVKRKK
jgi:hypothetical protein